MNNNKKLYLALVFLLIFNSSSFAANYLPNKSIKKQSIYHQSLDFSRVVVHHSNSKDVSSKIIDRWHKQKGFKQIGYHFVIRQSGKIEIGRPLHKQGAHAIGRNNYIGICLTGRDTFSSAQIKSLYHLLGVLGVRDIERHHEKCPGIGLNVEEIQERLDSMYGGGPSYEHEGKATYYKDWKTANGENMYLQPFAKTCATWFYPIGTRLLVENYANGKSVIVRVNDRGPNEQLLINKSRIIDLSPSAFKAISSLSKGEISVGIDIIK